MISIEEGQGELADVSEFAGIKHAADATESEKEAFYAQHGENTERQIPSDEEIRT